MAKTSIMFIPPFTNCHLEGLVANLSMYSRVNQVMQTASTIASLGLSICLPSSSQLEILGIVLRVKATVDRTIKLMEMTATTQDRYDSHINTNLFTKSGLSEKISTKTAQTATLLVTLQLDLGNKRFIIFALFEVRQEDLFDVEEIK